MEGVKGIQPDNETLCLVIDRNLDRILEHIHILRAKKLEVMPMSLKEIFLQSLKVR
jgi:hypothetical protein